MAWRKSLKFILPVLLIGGILLYGFWPRPLRVDVAAVQRAPMTLTIEQEGRTRVVDRYIISAPVSGVACQHDLHVGDAVRQGQVLLQLDSMQSEVLDPRRRAEAEARVAASRSALRAAEEKARAAAADAEYAAAELARLEPLFSAGHIPRDTLDRARSQARSSEAAQRSADFAVDVTRYELTAAQTALKYSAAQEMQPTEKVPIRAPVDGRILKVQHECKGIVSVGQPLLEVGDTQRLEVEIDVLSEDAVKIHSGMQVLLGRWGGEQDLEGRVRTVEPVGFTKISALGVEEQRVWIIVDFVSDYEQWARLGDGYRVEASFILWQGEDVLQVPAGALFRDREQWYVYRIDHGRAQRTPVQLGRRTGLRAQVVDGIAEGQQVILHPDDRIADGVRVTGAGG